MQKQASVKVAMKKSKPKAHKISHMVIRGARNPDGSQGFTSVSHMKHDPSGPMDFGEPTPTIHPTAADLTAHVAAQAPNMDTGDDEAAEGEAPMPAQSA